jgi:hypothetical protein
VNCFASDKSRPLYKKNRWEIIIDAISHFLFIFVIYPGREKRKCHPTRQNAPPIHPIPFISYHWFLKSECTHRKYGVFHNASLIATLTQFWNLWSPYLIVIPTTIARTADNIRRGDLRQQRDRPHRFSPAPPPVAKDTGNRRAPSRPTNPEAEPACTLPSGGKRV